MAYRTNNRGKSPIKTNIFFLLFFAIGGLLLASFNTPAQSAKPTPKPTPVPSTENSVTIEGYEITSSVEAGVRGISVNGSDNKFRSDYNYRAGFRVFDSSFMAKRKEGSGGAFDTLLVNASGWGGDPSGFLRVNAEKTGYYRFNANIRRVNFFNNLPNHARNGHNADNQRDFGDFDLKILPENENIRFSLGAGYNRNRGTGSITNRAYSDEFSPIANFKSNTIDFRAGVEGNLLGFNVLLGYGHRQFRDNTDYTIVGTNPGFNLTNTTVYTNFLRQYPIRDTTDYLNFNVHRTIAKKLDITARVIYSSSVSKIGIMEYFTGRDNSNNFVDADVFNINGNSKRPQTRGDLGITYNVTDNFTISNTFSFDQFNITGGSIVDEALATRTAAGVTRAAQLPYSFYYRLTGFKRYLNTLEGDYQFNDKFGIHLGWRYGHRKIRDDGYNYTVRSSSGVSAVTNPSVLCPAPTGATNPATICGEEENSTNTFIAGFKAKPMKNWTIFGDLEHGTADNAFTRLANYNFNNFRIRSRWSLNRFSFNLSGITKDNENPSTSTAPPANYPTGNFIANTKSRIFSAFVDVSPVNKLTLSGGYTYQHLTSESDIVINTGTLVRGFSRYYLRDNYFFVDVSAQPVNRVSFFASFRYNKDNGQGSRVTTGLPGFATPTGTPNLVTSYPFVMFTGESRLAIRLTKNIDWNLGYQYIGYRDRFPADANLWVFVPQDYHANLPYTSLRIYIGRGSDR
jgi:hypothetical protein